MRNRHNRRNTLINYSTIFTQTKGAPGFLAREARGNILSLFPIIKQCTKKLSSAFTETVPRGSDWIRTNDTPGMNRMLWPTELRSQMVAGVGLEPTTSGL